MEILLICLAVAFMATGKFQKDTAQAAYKAGKEPPGLAKARLRHEAGGGRWSSPTGKPSKPKGPGATRLVAATKWAHACEKAKDRMEDRHQRWRAWYREQAPDRDAAWREKQQKRMDRRGERLDRWQGRWTRAKDNLNPANLRRDRGEGQAWNENAARDEDTEQMLADARDEAQQLREQEQQQAQPDTAQSAEGQGNAETGGAAPAEPNGAVPAAAAAGAAGDAAIPQQFSNTASPLGGIVDYQSAAIALQQAAERVEQYRTDLSAMADGLSGKQWGVEVHGPIRDMDTNLAEIAGGYRDLAAQMQQQGDNVRDTEDAHPYVPGEHVVNA